VKSGLLAIALTVALSLPAHADLIAQAYAGVYPNSVSSIVNGVTSAAAFEEQPGNGAFIDTASAQITPGFFKMYAGVTEGIAAPGTAYSGTAQSEVDFSDFITTNGSEFVLPVHVDGSIGVDFSLGDVQFPGVPPQIDVHWLVACTVYDLSDNTHVGTNFCSVPESSTDFTSSTSIDRTFLFATPTKPGDQYYFSFTFREYALGNTDGNGIFSNASIVGDFSHTGIIEPAEVLDANGQSIANPIITSSSGYDYLHPAGPGTAATPEPGTRGVIGSKFNWHMVRQKTSHAGA
jgi:hypothetical protein